MEQSHFSIFFFQIQRFFSLTPITSHFSENLSVVENLRIEGERVECCACATGTWAKINNALRWRAFQSFLHDVCHVQIVPQHPSPIFPTFPHRRSSKLIQIDHAHRNGESDHERDQLEQILERVAKVRLEDPAGQDARIEFPIRLHSDRCRDGGRDRCIQTHRDPKLDRSSDRNGARGGALHGHTPVREFSPTYTGPRLDVPNRVVRQLLQRDDRSQVQVPPRKGDGWQQRDQLHDSHEGEQTGLRQLGQDGKFWMVLRRRVEVFQEIGKHDDTRVQKRHCSSRYRGPGHH